MALIDAADTYQLTNAGAHVDGTDVYNSNQNLLMNPWFTVNQEADKTQWSGTGQFTIDRWYHAPTTSDSVMTLLSNHEVRLTNTTTTNAIFMQKVPVDTITPLAGKKVTLSINVTGYQTGAAWLMQMRWLDALDTQIGFTSVNLQAGFNTVTGTVPDNAAYGYFRIQGSSGTIRFDRVKLEAGTVSTLMNDAAPDFASELAKCRYYKRVIPNTGTGAAIVGSGFAQNATQARINLADGSPVNPIAPTIPTPAGDLYVVNSSSASNTVSAVSALWATNPMNPPTLALTTSGLTANQPVTFRIGNNSKLVLIFDSI